MPDRHQLAVKEGKQGKGTLPTMTQTDKIQINPFTQGNDTGPADISLVESAQNGDREALEKLILRHQAWIYNIALRMVLNPQSAEDVIQDILIKIIAKLSTFKGRSSFRTWLYRIVANHVINMKKKHCEEKIISFEAYGKALDETPKMDLPDRNSVPVDVQVLVEEAKIGCMTAMLLCLDREQQLIYILGEIFNVSDSIGGKILKMGKEHFRIKRGIIKVNGLNLFYRDAGSDNQSILCLHWKWGRGETWTDLMARYKERYRIIAPDQRGHGLSDKPIAQYAGEDFAADMHGLIKLLKCDPVIAVGHSIGGRNAAYLAALYPHAVKSLVILDAKSEGPERLSSLSPDQVPSIDSLTESWPTPYSSYAEAIKDLSNRFSHESNIRYFLESLIETVDGYDFLFSRYAMSAIDIYYQGRYHILKQIQSSVLLIRAKNSWYLSKEEADKMKALIRHCTYFEISDSDHMVYADNPDEFYPVFEQFINEYG